LQIQSETLPIDNLAKLLTMEISLLKPNLELMSYQLLVEEGLNKIPKNLDAKLVKLVFKEYEAYNIICNVMQIT
jgi:hypothetical protein